VAPDRLKAWVDTPVLTHMPQPITTNYASLTTNKLPSNQTLAPASNSSLSIAAHKNVHILSKFWGDEVKELMEDTLSHGKRLEVDDHVDATLSDFKQHYPCISESTKAARKKKKQENKVKPSSFNSAGMRTRAQKRSSKAALTDTK
jgi:hypothetical protein